MNHQAAVEIEPEDFTTRFTRRVRHDPPRSIQHILLIIIAESLHVGSKLPAHPANAGSDIVGIYNTGGATRAVGASLAKFGVAGDVVFVCHELTRDTQELLDNHIATVALDQNPEQQAATAVDILLRYFGYIEQRQLSCPVPFRIYTYENADYSTENENAEQ